MGKNIRRIFMANTRGKKEVRIRLTTFYKVLIGLAIVTIALYAAIVIAESNGYMLINISTKYWAYYAMLISLILLVGRIIVTIPKNKTTAKSVKICVAIVSIATIFLQYVAIVNAIDSASKKYAVVKSDDGKHEVVIFRMNSNQLQEQTEGTEIDPAEGASAFFAFRKVNSLFCYTGGDKDVIIVPNAEEPKLFSEFNNEKCTIYLEGMKDDPTYTIEVPLK